MKWTSESKAIIDHRRIIPLTIMDVRGLPVCLLLTFFLALSDAELMQKILRHRRQTVLSSKEHNISLLNTNKSVLFNHIYNIHVPASGLCTLDQSAQDAAASAPPPITEHTVNNENQIIFTHRIHIPRQACGCAEDLPALTNLLKRLEMLEGQVSALKQQYSSGSPCCNTQAKGEVKTKSYCNGHGSYSAELYRCVCESGWKGLNCTEPECARSCGERGRCVQGRCQCDSGFSGVDCSVEECPVDCGEHGQCEGGLCVCSEGFFGDDCSQTKCVNNCFGRGLCVDGECKCDPPWSGQDCTKVTCPNDCSDRGRCVNGTCFCHEGHKGLDCGERTCLNNCHGNGFCVEGRCVCTAGYSGQDCSHLTCLNDCSSRGSCFSGVCICDVGYQGEDCSQLACVNNCNTRGQCINGQCACDVGFQGTDCSELSCPGSCNHRGRCVNGQCVCHEGFTGEDCSIKTCSSNCFSRGTCINGHCRCYAGFSGEDCSQVSCPNNCKHRGRCLDGQCICEEGFTGEDCSHRACPNDCMKRGYCLDGTCICHEGYFNEDCSGLVCPDNCNNRGRCVKGRCSCDRGYEGESCATRACLNNCHNNGQCVDGQCVCEEGYTGEDCSRVSPPKDLRVDAVGEGMVDLVWTNAMLVAEYLVTCTSPGGHTQEFTVTGDQTAATVKDLDPGTEYAISVVAVLSGQRSEPISTRVATLLPLPEGVRFTSVGETSVEVTWDKPESPFDGWEIIFRNMKEENGKIVKTVPASQNQFTQSGLGPGQEYEVSINIIKNNTRGPQTSERVTTRIEGPQQLQVKDVTSSSALVSWSKPMLPADKVIMSYAPSSDPSAQVNVEVFTPDHQSSIEALRPDTEYTVSLVCRTDNSSSYPVNATFTTALDAPRDLRSVSQSDSSITVQWTNTEAEVQSYRVKYSPISGAKHGEDLFPQGPGDTTTATITGLLPGTEYGIGVTAVKNERESIPATINAETDLDPPKSLEKTESTETSLTLTWKKPQAKTSGYKLMCVSADGQFEEFVLQATATSFVVPNLSAGTTYNFTLTAERGHKRSAPAQLSESTARRSSPPDVLSLTFKEAPSISQSEQDSGTINTSDSSVLDSERTSTSDINIMGSGAEPQNYGIEELLFANITDTPFLYNETPERETTDEIHEYPFPEEPNTLVLNLTLSDITWDSITAVWTSMGEDFDSFVIEVTNMDNMAESQNLTLSGGAFSLLLSGLSPNTTYSVGLYGLYQGTFLEPTYSEATTEAEPEVEHLFVSDVTANSFRLSWTAEEDMFDRFLIKLRDSKRVAHPQEYSVHGDERTLLLKGLMGGTEYEIEVYGIKLGWRSQGITGTAQTGLSVPQGLHFTEVTDTSAVVHWTQPQSPVDIYRITYVPFEGGGPLLLTVDGSVFEAVLPNLTPGQMYQVTVNAVKGLEESDSSTNVVTTALDRPGHPTAVNITEVSATLQWQPSVASVDGYIITYTSDTAAPVQAHAAGDTVAFEMTSLTPATHYTVALQSVKDAQKSDSAVTEFTTDVDPPWDVSVVDIQMDRATLTWRPPQAAVTGYTLSFSSADATIREVVLSSTASSYIMDELMGSSQYTVNLTAIARSQKSRIMTTVFTTTGQLYKYPKDCAQIFLSGETASGLYTIFIAGEESQPLQVYCDMTTDGGGWMVFLRRQNGQLEFFRNWKNYTAGFGNMNNEFWLGLSNLHKITSSGHYELRVDLKDNEESAYAQYDKFTIAEPRTRFKIYLGAYSGTAGDSMIYHQGRPFSTYDNDNDIAVTNCALSYKGAFWYKNCHRVNLMGKYGDSTHSKGINWFHWKGHEHSIEFAEMKMRPADFRNGENRKKRS